MVMSWGITPLGMAGEPFRSPPRGDSTARCSFGFVVLVVIVRKAPGAKYCRTSILIPSSDLKDLFRDADTGKDALPKSMERFVRWGLGVVECSEVVPKSYPGKGLGEACHI